MVRPRYYILQISRFGRKNAFKHWPGASVEEHSGGRRFLPWLRLAPTRWPLGLAGLVGPRFGRDTRHDGIVSLPAAPSSATPHPATARPPHTAPNRPRPSGIAASQPSWRRVGWVMSLLLRSAGRSGALRGAAWRPGGASRPQRASGTPAARQSGTSERVVVLHKAAASVAPWVGQAPTMPPPLRALPCRPGRPSSPSSPAWGRLGPFIWRCQWCRVKGLRRVARGGGMRFGGACTVWLGAPWLGHGHREGRRSRQAGRRM